MHYAIGAVLATALTVTAWRWHTTRRALVRERAVAFLHQSVLVRDIHALEDAVETSEQQTWVIDQAERVIDTALDAITTRHDDEGDSHA